jgi:hypothetical protein
LVQVADQRDRDSISVRPMPRPWCSGSTSSSGTLAIGTPSDSTLTNPTTWSSSKATAACWESLRNRRVLIRRRPAHEEAAAELVDGDGVG